MSASNVNRLDKAGVLDKKALNKDQKNAINNLSEKEVNKLIIISSKLKADMNNPDDYLITFFT